MRNFVRTELPKSMLPHGIGDHNDSTISNSEPLGLSITGILVCISVGLYFRLPLMGAA